MCTQCSCMLSVCQVFPVVWPRYHYTKLLVLAWYTLPVTSTVKTFVFLSTVPVIHRISKVSVAFTFYFIIWNIRFQFFSHNYFLDTLKYKSMCMAVFVCLSASKCLQKYKRRFNLRRSAFKISILFNMAITSYF